jgi:Uma2 family endonuclease
VTIDTSGHPVPTHYKSPLVSWEQFHDWVGGENRAEWVDGEIVETMPPNLRHVRLTRLIFSLLNHLVEQQGLGEVLLDVLMRLRDRQSGRVPDVMFVASRHEDRLTDTYLDGPADLAVEVVSPDGTERDRHDKLAEYEAAGVPEYWLIDEIQRQARFYVLDSEGRYREAAPDAEGIYTSTVLSGLRLRVEWLWREKLPTLSEALADLPE